MIKGVNRQIIEVTNPENAYFEKAILYVRADRQSLSRTELRNQAVSYVSGIAHGRQKKKERK